MHCFLLPFLLTQTVFSVAFAQNLPTLPAPFAYPNSIIHVPADMEIKAAPTIELGSLVIELGHTRLSQVARRTKAELQHSGDGLDYLCYSTEENNKPQNIWLIIGERGRINEARIATTDSSNKCPPLDKELTPIRISGRFLGESLQEMKKTFPTEPNFVSPEDGWVYWAYQQVNKTNKKKIDFNLLGIEIVDNLANRILAIEQAIDF